MFHVELGQEWKYFNIYYVEKVLLFKGIDMWIEAAEKLAELDKYLFWKLN